ncbi:MAG: bifunctional DNA primase/polymerase, partial [Dehalococcoidia bacterium]
MLSPGSSPGLRSLGTASLPLCDANHEFVSAKHINGYQRRNGTVVAPCKSPGKVPLEPGYPRFALMGPTDRDIRRMFATHQGNMGNVVAVGNIVMDIDLRSCGLESIAALTERYSAFPLTPTV